MSKSTLKETVAWNSDYWRKIRNSTKPANWEIDLDGYSDRDKETLGIYINRDGKAAVAIKRNFYLGGHRWTQDLDIYGYLKVYTSQAGVDLYYVPYEDGAKISSIAELIKKCFTDPDQNKRRKMVMKMIEENPCWP